ncbi:unnamed protein product [Knipowitschia caucasica]
MDYSNHSPLTCTWTILTTPLSPAHGLFQPLPSHLHMDYSNHSPLTCTWTIPTTPLSPAHGLFQPLPSGRRLRSIRTRTSRHKNSFFPSAVGLLNTS